MQRQAAVGTRALALWDLDSMFGAAIYEPVLHLITVVISIISQLPHDLCTSVFDGRPQAIMWEYPRLLSMWPSGL